jgi:hypothetical protein
MDWLVEANVLEKCAVSIFRAQVETERFSETLASNNQSSRQPNPKEHQICHCHENLKPHIS